jgi:hypothetical protein
MQVAARPHDVASPNATPTLTLAGIKPKKRVPADASFRATETRAEKKRRLGIAEDYGGDEGAPFGFGEAALTRREGFQLNDLAKALANAMALPRASPTGGISAADESNLRKHVQLSPYLKSNAAHRQNILDQLRPLLGAARVLRIPDDITADAKLLEARWSNGDYDPSLLRGIERRQRIVNKRCVVSYSIQREYSFKRDAGIPGHNDLFIGQWWPLQICAVRDGAHGLIEASVGTNNGRAVSVIIGGGVYANEDHLEYVWYCGPPGRNGSLSAASRALETGILSGQPVRVLRSAGARTPYSPAVGLRYDGLYNVVEGKDAEQGGSKFKLVRCAPQDPVRYCGAVVKPNVQDVEQWRREMGK